MPLTWITDQVCMGLGSVKQLGITTQKNKIM